MAKGSLIAVFILPVIFTIVFSSIVMAGALDELDRELDFWPSGISKTSHNSSMKILGLEDQYSSNDSVSVKIKVSDPAFECGDLYITIYSKESVITQSGFFEQCFKTSGTLPIKDSFSEVLKNPGTYNIKAEMKDKSQKNTISVSGKFTVI